MKKVFARVYNSSKKKVYTLALVFGIFLILIGSYLYGSSYLNAIIDKEKVTNALVEDVSVTGDDVSVRFIKDSGVVVSFSAIRTATEDNANVIQAVTPRLEYAFVDKTADPIIVNSTFGTFNQATKVVLFEERVVIVNGATVVRADEAYFYLATDTIIFPRGAVIQNENTLKADELEWNVVTNSSTAKNITIYIVPEERR